MSNTKRYTIHELKHNLSGVILVVQANAELSKTQLEKRLKQRICIEVTNNKSRIDPVKEVTTAYSDWSIHDCKENLLSYDAKMEFDRRIKHHRLMCSPMLNTPRE